MSGVRLCEAAQRVSPGPYYYSRPFYPLKHADGVARYPFDQARAEEQTSGREDSRHAIIMIQMGRVADIRYELA